MALQVKEFTDNSKEFKDGMQKAVARALEAIGIQAEAHTKQEITSIGLVDTGRLRNSITHTVKDDTAYIGSELDYALYHEVGTGIYYPTGRKEPWRYVDDKGQGHTTRGVQAKHFLKNAITEHQSEYKRIAEAQLKGGV